MKNAIRVSLEFSFKGETYSPSAVVDLDQLDPGQGPPDWHALVAKRCQIDTYSYMYEIMQASEPRFSDAEGLAEPYLQNSRFDFDGYRQSRQQAEIVEQLADIAKRLLDVDSLKDHPALEEALVQAYLLGRQS